MLSKRGEKKKSCLTYSKRKGGGGGGGVSRKLWRGEKFHPVEIDLTQEERGAKMDINTKRKREKSSEKCLRSWPDSGYIYRGRETLGRFVSGQETGPAPDPDRTVGGAENSICSCLYCEVRHHVDLHV